MLLSCGYLESLPLGYKQHLNPPRFKYFRRTEPTRLNRIETPKFGATFGTGSRYLMGAVWFRRAHQDLGGLR